jgi:hypothetical protein
MTALFATLLFLSLTFALAVAFSSPKSRPALKWLLLLTLSSSWGALALAVVSIVSRTSSTLVTPGGARQPHLIGQAAREAFTLLLSLGGPALLATLLGLLALKATRPRSEDVAARH